jgi:CubicO group peptidase (beta-lactamase class C family)
MGGSAGRPGSRGSPRAWCRRLPTSCRFCSACSTTAVHAGGFGWMGGTGTTAYIDPERGLAGVLMTQRAMESSQPPESFVRFWDAVYRGL